MNIISVMTPIRHHISCNIQHKTQKTEHSQYPTITKESQLYCSKALIVFLSRQLAHNKPQLFGPPTIPHYTNHSVSQFHPRELNRKPLRTHNKPPTHRYFTNSKTNVTTPHALLNLTLLNHQTQTTNPLTLKH